MFPTGSLASSDIARLTFYVAVLGALLMAGVILRSKIKLFRKIYMPASLIAGIIGLLLSYNFLGILPEEMTSTFGAIPGSLIVVIFAPMLMCVNFHDVHGAGNAKNLVVSQLVVGSVGSFLQIGLPCLVTAFLLQPVFKVHELFPSIVEIGWAGGHGTAGGMDEVFTSLNWSDGTSLALTSATVGLVVGIIGGMIMINHAVRHNYLSPKTNHGDLSLQEQGGFAGGEKTPNAYSTVSNSIVESFAFHLALIGIAVVIGYVLKWLFGFIIDGMPLFPMVMLGGFILNRIMAPMGLLKYVDPNTFSRIQGMALDILVVAAVSSIKISVVAENAVPLLIISLAGLVAMMFYFYWICPRLFSEDWFEQAILHFGVNTGVTAVGFMLLRVVDPEVKTLGSKAYAIQAPITSPLFGGGLITALLPGAILSYGNVKVGIVSLVIVAVALLIAKILGCYHKPDRSYKGESK